MIRRTLTAVGVALWLAAVLPGHPDARADEPILTVAGIPGGVRELALDDLREMGATDLTTSTPWTDGAETFTGVSGRRFVEVLGANGTEVVAEGLNGYRVVIPFAVLGSDDAVVAYARDGEPMSVREKGPLWIVFPFDADRRFLGDTYRTYSIWNLTRLEFR